MVDQQTLDDDAEALAANIQGPASVTVAGEIVIAKTADDIIKGDRYLAAKLAASSPTGGMRFGGRFTPGGCG